VTSIAPSGRQDGRRRADHWRRGRCLDGRLPAATSANSPSDPRATRQPAVTEFTPEPDAAIVPAGDYDHAHPTTALLVIEVADSSLARDRRKAGLYAAAGIPEC